LRGSVLNNESDHQRIQDRNGLTDPDNSTTLPGDQALMEQVRDGDLRQLALLFERHHRALFHFFLRMVANREVSEDLVQEVFFRILRYRHTYNAIHGFTAWMYQIARNVHLDHLQKQRMHASLPSSTSEEESGMAINEVKSPALPVDEAISRNQEVMLLRQALERLPEDKREVLVLSRYQNLKYEEIAEILGCEVGTVKVRVFRAVRALGQIFFELQGGRTA
jgi:RNA polymerase sigma factor (sigma-70 family)